MSNPDIAALDKANHQILATIHHRCRRREVFNRRPVKDPEHLERDRQDANEIAALERQWVAARENADQRFMAMALDKPVREQVILYKVRGGMLQVGAKLDARYAATAGRSNCPVADDYALLAQAQDSKGKVFLALADEAKQKYEDYIVERAQGTAHPGDRDRNVRTVARQLSKRSEMEATGSDEQARLQARAQELNPDLPAPSKDVR